MEREKPPFIAEVVSEVTEDYRSPTDFFEWAEAKRVNAIIGTWQKQQDQERGLRRVISFWVFGVISFQVIAIFIFVFLDARGYMKIAPEIAKILMPTAIAEVFGMGYLVVKYLFKHPEKDIFDIYYKSPGKSS